jgi:hypothetical protein
LAGNAGHQMQVSVKIEVGADRGIDEAGIETFDRDGSGDALAELGKRLPDHALLLNVEVVEGGDVTPRGKHQVTGG